MKGKREADNNFNFKSEKLDELRSRVDAAFDEHGDEAWEQIKGIFTHPKRLLVAALAAVLLVGVFYAPDEFNEVVVMKKFHFWLPVIEFVLVAALLFITAFNPSPAGWESVMSLVSGNWAVAFWLLFVIVGLVLPTILECWMLWLAKHEFETSRTGQMISALSDAGVLVGGFMLRLLIVSAAVPITIIQPWML